METVIGFLNRLASKGVRLSVAAGQLNCYAQKGVLTDDLRDGIVRYRSEIITLLEARRKRPQTQDRAEFPLSAGERGLYVLQSLHPEMSAYNVPICFKINSPIDTEILARAWGFVLEQFPILTARVIENEGTLYHRLDAACRTTMLQRNVDFADDLEFLSFLQRQAKQPFDLNRGPLTRVELFIREKQSPVVLLTVHHIIFDGTSAVIVLRSLFDFYQQLCDGKAVRLSQEVHGYQEFVAWEEAMLESPEGAAHAGYWQQQLDGELPALEILSDLPRLTSPSFEGRTLVEDLPEDLSLWVREFAKANALPPSVVFLGVFQLLLHRYTNQEDVIVGMPVMGRPSKQFAYEVGYFINMVPLRVHCGARIKLLDFLRKVQGTMMDALYHSSYPFPLMLEKVESRHWNKNPIFQVTYAYQNFVKPTDFAFLLGQPTLQLESVAGIWQEGDFDLGLEIFEDPSSAFVVHIKYNPDAYTRDTIDDIFERYCVLLRAASEKPDAFTHEYPILSDVERRKLLLDFNATRAEYPTDRCLHDLFVEQVASHAERAAVVCGEDSLTYEQLQAKTRDLALYLQSAGVGPGRLVGLCMDRSLDMIVGMLGILRAGGAYVPLDPDHPDERLAYMLQDSRASIVLTQERLRDKLSALISAETQVIALDRQWPEIGDRVAELKASNVRFQHDVEPADLAYVIYTSGSTGKPKGVAIEHHSPVTLVYWASEVFSREELAGVLASTSICFDLSVYEIFVTLANGGTIILVPNALGLIDLSNQQSVTLINTVPSAMEELVRVGAIPKSVQTINLAGEPLSPALVDAIYDTGSVRKVYDLYGPSEDTTYSTYALRQKNAPPVIGRPIANTQAYILDPHQHPQPIGVPGELYLAGDGLAREYLNRPELTQERFVANPFQPGTRMYRTGDLARWLEDGTIQYLGRIDTQVKIRGFRIELGEIEARLNEHSGIQDAVVIAQGEGASRQLVGFYRAKETTADHIDERPAEELKAHLLQTLPAYMVPAAFVSLAAIPLNPNGKVDRRALAQMDVTMAAVSEYVAPRNDAEQRLVAIWAEVLNLAPEKIGINDDFFELGGHSLLATQLISKIRSRFEVELPLKALFEGSTIAHLAQLVGRAMRSDVPPIRPVDRSELDRLPLSFAQERLWFLNELAPESVGYNVPGAAVITGELDVDQLEQAFNLVIARHESLRTVFPSQDGQPHQRILDGIDFKLERVDISQHETREARDITARQVCQAEATTPFNLAAGPLLRGKVIKLAEDEHILMLNMHHIISDGWSVGVFIKEVGAILEALRQGRRPELPPLPIQYVDYSVWQRRWLEEGGVLEQQLAYWQKKLSGVPESLDLVTDHPRPSVQAFAGATYAFALDAQLTGDLKRLGERRGATLYMVLLAAFKALLHRYTGQNDICVGSPIANRQYGETEGLIGMFVNTLALRSQVEGDDTVGALLSKVKATCLEAYEHQDAPFEKVVDMLRLQRNLAISPLVQVMLILQNADMGATDPKIRRYPVDNGISKFDLTVELTETPDGLAGVIEYSTALYEAQTIARMAGHFVAVCRAITAMPTAKVRELEYLSDLERRRVLIEYNATGAEYPKDRCLHDAFVEQVALHAEKRAVVCGEDHLTYQRLYGRSRDLALYLQSLGVKPDSLICLCVERSLDMVVGLLAVVQAGGAYVPLDPEYPDERLAYMLRDSGATIVLTQGQFAERVASFVPQDTKLIALDDDWPSIIERVADLKARNVQLRRDVRPHHLAYVIYTSGSTGEPKGVMVEHRNLANLVEWHRTAFELCDRDVSTAIAGVGFDAAVWEIWPSLCVGATLASPAADVLRDPEALLRWWETLPVDVSFLPTPLAEFAFSRGMSNAHLRALLVGGDRLDQLPSQPQPFLLVNNYGPTECTVVATSGVLEGDAEVLHIGRPIANTQIYILDVHRQPVPVGVAGEIYVGGASVARGYLNRPELTEERFLRDPFSSDPAARMYRTGDLARWLDDGNVQYLGRIDTQVKIRGFRIETGEIEFRFKQHPAIQDSAVITQGEGANKQLIAFYRAKETTGDHIVELPVEELRAHLLRTLPDYMVPAAFVSVAAIPLNPNGKVDRRALAQIGVTVATGQKYVAPRNDTEEQLVEIWAAVLNLAPEKIGVNDNFFELGGHSLLATQLISRIRGEMDVDLPLKALFGEGTVAQLAELIEKAEKNEIPPIRPVDRTKFDRLPLSFAQERLWFLNELEPASPSYNVPGAVTIRGELDISQLEQAFNLVIARHENLRTVFPSQEGRAHQQILDRVDFALERIDLTHWETREARDREARRLCETDAATPFDLAGGPLLRGRVIRLAEHEHILMLNMHHIISDGWSVGVLFGELSVILKALREGRHPELPPLPIQYVDYSVWQRRWLDEGGILEEQLAYWREKLAGVPESLDLATDFPRPSVQTFAGAAHAFALDSQLTGELKRVAQQQGGTLYMVLLAAFKVLLHRYTGQNDICVGSPIANRQYGETEGLIGMFVNTLALRSQVDDNDTFASVLAKVKATCLEAYEHQDAPFEKVIDSLHLQRTLALSPLFQVMVILQNADMGAVDPSIEMYELDAAISKFDLTVELTETAGGLAGSIRYRTALYRSETIARMTEHFAALCQAIIAMPAAEIRNLDYLSETEKQTLLVDFNATQIDYPMDKCVHQLFAERAALHPDNPAVVFGDQKLTYRELDRKSRDLAAYLRARGVRPDSLVGLHAERSLDMVVGLMGILQAGGAYVPLDPDLPEVRLRSMLEDAAPVVVLTQERLKATLPDTSMPVIALDGEWTAIEGSAHANLDQHSREVRPENLAYVIYTSGSTGVPKGVMIQHGSLTNYLTWVTGFLASQGVGCLPAVTNLSFDASLKQIFGPLIIGNTVVLVEGASSDPEGLLRTLEENPGSALNCVPSVWRMLIDLIEKRPGKVENLQSLLLGGEEIPRELIRQSLDLNPELQITNLYGPTEATANATFARGISPEDVSIGRPVANTQIYILDRHRRAVPIGVVGEIYIGGVGVARGYLNRADLTAERFIADPFRADPTARLYKSGDLGRRRADGSIEYVGRNDHQVKLRGQRIELGEIEAQLSKLAGVKEAVVIAREDQPGEKRLVAYVTTTGEPLGAEELRLHLLARVPQYMVPAAFVELEALPLTSNKKVNRKALPKPEAQAYASRAYEPPQGQIEETLVAIWQELLHIERVGRYDDFFELGGHSLLATQLISKIRRQLDVDIPLKALFEDGSVARLAQWIAKAERNEVPPIRPVDRLQFDRLPLSFAQERLWFLNELEPDSAGYNIPGAVTIRGELDVLQLEDAFNVIIARHENLRTVFPSYEGQAHQQILDDVDFELERVDLSHYTSADARADEARRLCQAEAATPFDLICGPLLRGKVIKLAGHEHILMLNMHHIISDGWSVGVFIRELGLILEAFRKGRQPELPPLPIQYVDYSVWQRRWLEEGGILDRQLGYWQQKLAGLPESLDLATDYPRPSVQTFAGATHAFVLDAELTGSLKRLAEQHGGTLYMVLVAAFKALLHRYTGQNDICVGAPIANRQYGETEGLIGMFVNTLALRSEVAGDDTFAELLTKVRATCLEAYEYQDAPFEKVVDLVRPQRNLAISPLFQVMVILQNVDLGVLDQHIQPYPLDSGISKFDLTVAFMETQEGLSGSIEYSTALYKPETIERTAAHFTALCRAITATPTARVRELDYLGETEKHRLLVDFNATHAEYPKDQCLHELFIAQVERDGEKTAVLCGNERLTYRQLLGRSRDLARYLQSQGVEPDTFVGICMERSLEMMVGLLGVLQAGGAYVPLDPGYPDERLAYMLRDSRAAVVLTQEKLQDKLSALSPAGTQLIAMDRQWAEIGARAAGLKADGVELQQRVRPHHLAYVIYTSGSTGQPKGVAIEHHSPVTLVHWAREVYSPEELAGVLASTSICFDLSVYEIFLTLASGGTIILVPNALGLVDLADRESVTLINTVPSAMEELVRLNAIPASVQTINLAGEPLSARLVDRIYDTGTVRKVYDLYGPSEDTTYSTYVLRRKNGPQTIGRPVANTQVYILDRHKQIQPIGIPGELHIAGDGLARGYLNRPELTQEKFVANPFEAGARMYETGDLARWLDDGTLQYLGRIDTQVKLRGFRIELGEIEARLNQHPEIHDGVVIAHGPDGNKQLIAFYRAKGSTPDRVVEQSQDELRAHLSKTLPEYMVPAAFVSLVAIPLNPNGKVDRRALARMDVTTVAAQEYVAPRNDTERRLVAIWGEILGRQPETVGVHDNFFELGGHSLLATRLMSQIRGQLNVDMPLKALFERGSVAQLAEWIATAEKSRIPPIRPIDRSQFDRLPLSFSQERLWFINQLEPGSAGYNVPAAVTISGELDVDHVERAFNLIIARHENLRTVFPSDEGQAHQQILDRVDFALERIDLTGHETRVAREEEARRLCQTDAATPFDLATGPLIRGRVIKVAEQEHVLMLNMHHIIGDGWSFGVLIKELSVILDALREGRHPELAPLPIQYADYGVWQRKWLGEGGILERQLAYWKEKLAGVPESLELPTDSPRPSVRTFAGATQPFAMDAQLTGQLKRLAEQQGGTLYMVLLAAFKVLLHRYTGQTDICVGSPIANRQYAETEGLIGMFVNTLALRSRVDGRDTFSSLLTKVKATCLEAYENQDAPFEKVVDIVHPQRNLAVSPLFQVMVLLQNADMGDRPAQNIRLYPLESGISKFDVTAEFTETEEGLAGAIRYSTVLYQPETIERMVTHFLALCRAIAVAPTAPIGALEYMSAAERRHLLVDSNATEAVYPEDKCIHQLFAEQAAMNPERTAVVFGEQTLTFGELAQKSRALALRLRAAGVITGSLVGLCMERSLDMIVGLMGILEAGGAYVPLDPDYPAVRLQYMLQDASPTLVLTQERLQARLPQNAARIIALDGTWSDAEPQPRIDADPIDVTPGHLAYVIYTSGSTGVPKGVMIRHRNVVNLWRALAEAIYADHAEWTRVSVNASLSFDSSVKQLVQLLSGRTLVIIPQDVRLDANALSTFISLHRVDVFDCTPSQLASLLGAGMFESGGHTPMAFLVGGEAIDAHLWQSLAARRDTHFYNVYGPAECTVDATVARVTPEERTPHIGRPIANTKIYILDGRAQPVPIGVFGEIHIGGAGVACGYLRRPDLTAERFIADAFSGEAQARLYKSGDLGRWRADGKIEFLGRNDQQVKLRGQRIELGEIEAQLAKHAGVREAVVIAREDEPGEKRLVAYVTTSGQPLAVEELRSHMLASVPQYMVPAAFVELDALPLTPNKKVDRKALPRPEAQAFASKEYEPPQGEIEEALAGIWREVLHIERVGRRDDFFELGGHSLSAVQLMAKINRRFDRLLPLSVMFTAPSVAALAKRISSDSTVSSDILVPIQTNGDAPPVFGVPGAGGNVLSLKPLSRALGTGQPFYGLQAVGLDGKTAPPNSVEETARLNVAALRTLQPCGPYRLIGHSYGGVVAYEMARLLVEQGEEISSLTLLDARAPSVMQDIVSRDEATELAEACLAAAGLYDASVEIDIEHLRQLAEDEKVQYVVQRLNDGGLETNAAQFGAFYRVYRANQVCYRTYTPSRLPLEVDVSLYRATQTDHDGTSSPDYGWSELLHGPIRIYDIEADHFSILEKARFPEASSLFGGLVDDEPAFVGPREG